jgi:hypothetical protein
VTQFTYAPHADANHALITKAYEELLCLTFDTHKLGGFVDLLVRIPTRGGPILQLVEIKTEDGVLRQSQERFIRDWGGYVVQVVRDRTDVQMHVERVQGRFKLQ